MELFTRTAGNRAHLRPPSKPLSLTVISVDDNRSGAGDSVSSSLRRASVVDMERVRLLKGDDGGDSGYVRRVACGDDLLLEQLLVDDPLVATIAAAQELTASSGEDSQSESCADIKHEPPPLDFTTPSIPLSTEMKLHARLAAAAHTPEDEIGLSPLEIRRKRNRESMQRARQRQRDDINSMKVAMRQLEAHFQRLSEQKEQQRIQSVPTSVRRPIDHIETEYRQLADASRRLKEEKFLLEKMVTEKTKTFRRLQQAMVDRKVELHIDPPLTPAPATISPGLAAEFFSPISEQQADDAIKRCYDDIVRLESVSKPLRNTATTQGPLIPPTSTFGWSMLCHLLQAESGFFVTFTKTFSDVTPDDVMLKTWTLFSRPENNTGAENGVIRMDTLQVVNDNAYVAFRDVQHPASPTKTLRTMFLRFRLQTEQGGYVIGRACMNPTNPELRALDERESNIIYGDYSSWIEFRRPADGSAGCEVKFGAILAYNTQEDMQLRLINALMTTIMWETTVIKPVFSLQNSLE